jgi:RimJ/RimL family protein N-acetyltransferase
VVASTSSAAFVGTVGLDRRDPGRPGSRVDEGLALEVSYVLDPAQWGHGYATEAVAAVLTWASGVLSDTHVVACTQTANSGSIALLQRLGFAEIDRFVEFDAEQGLWLRPLTAIEAPAPSR